MRCRRLRLEVFLVEWGKWWQRVLSERSHSRRSLRVTDSPRSSGGAMGRGHWWNVEGVACDRRLALLGGCAAEVLANVSRHPLSGEHNLPRSRTSGRQQGAIEPLGIICHRLIREAEGAGHIGEAGGETPVGQIVGILEDIDPGPAAKLQPQRICVLESSGVCVCWPRFRFNDGYCSL
jgi:hypothetical protein